MNRRPPRGSFTTDMVIGSAVLLVALALGFYVGWRSLSLPLPPDTPADSLPWEEEPFR